MHSPLAYTIAGLLGVFVAWFLTRSPDMRTFRVAQFIFLPVCFVIACYFLPDPTQPSSPGAEMARFVPFAAIMGFLALLLAPNIAYYCGKKLSDFLDPGDWTPVDEEMALRPIRKLIDRECNFEALTQLEELLKKHPPTYEAMLIKAKLLYHFGRSAETMEILYEMIELTVSTDQQLAVMGLLAALELPPTLPVKPLAHGVRIVQIHRELVLLQKGASDLSQHREILPGKYSVEETLQGTRRWLVLEGENWGNAERCWEAVQKVPASLDAPTQKGLFWRIARFEQSFSKMFKEKPRHHVVADARALFKEANQHIRQDNWELALPLLQKASTCDPDNYEIAYRWVQVARYVRGEEGAAAIMNKVLNQSGWTENEQHMLKALRRQGASQK